jgi:hypothetical protein
MEIRSQKLKAGREIIVGPEYRKMLKTNLFNVYLGIYSGSEKLMETLFAGCIPIYVGPNPEKFGIPKELVMRAQPSLHSIQEALLEVNRWDMSEFHTKLRAFLGSCDVRNQWEHTRVYERLLQKNPEIQLAILSSTICKDQCT